MMRPEDNPWLRHGPQGQLLRRLVRYHLLGWFCAGFSLVALLLGALLVIVRTPPVVVVSASGRLLGQIRGSGPTARPAAALLAAAMRFMRDYLSVNSDTIIHDYTSALHMMAPPLFRRTVQALRKTGYLARVRKLRARSWVDFDHGHARPKVLTWSQDTAQVRLVGTVHIVLANGHRLAQRFAVILAVTRIARTVAHASGIIVRAIHPL